MTQHRIFSTALALQGARTSRTERLGLGNSPEGQELAKALAEGVAEGITAEEMVAEVTKAMCGNDDLALEIIQAVQEVAKAEVAAHTRTVGGKVVQVASYNDHRVKAAQASSAAHGQSMATKGWKSGTEAFSHPSAIASRAGANATGSTERPDLEGRGQETIRTDLHNRASEAHEIAAKHHAGVGDKDAAAAHMEASRAHLAAAHSLQEVAKGHVQAHEREVGGKRVSVKAYETARDKAMEGSNKAAAATLQAWRVKSPEAHENAASAHEEAKANHAEAHEAHPGENEAAGVFHAKARETHSQVADQHRQTASDLRQGESYQRAADKAGIASNLASQAGTGAVGTERHAAAAKAHMEAHALNPNSKHKDLAESHDAVSKANTAFENAIGSPLHGRKAKDDAADASGQALLRTQEAHGRGTLADHSQAAEAHGKAAEAHLALHGQYESSEDGHHGQIARQHIDLNTYHTKMSHPAVAKAEGAMTSMDGGTDLAKKEGGAALAVEGRPGEKDPEEVGKAHVEGHTREVGGKVVQVASYDTHKQAAMKASSEAHAATGAAQTPEQHTAAAAGHSKAAVAHREAGKYAPETWMEKGHEDQAKLHEAYAQAHHAKAKAAGNRADTGVDQPPHTAQDIQNLEQHPDAQGFGYLGHAGRDAGTDQALEQAANKAGISHHELAAHVLSKSGRHMMDSLPGGAQVEEGKEIGKQALEQKHTQRVAHFQKWMTDPKNKKTYDIENYAKELGEKAGGKKEAAPAATKPKAEPATAAKSKLPDDPAEAHDHAEAASYDAWNGGKGEAGHQEAISALKHSVKKATEVHNMGLHEGDDAKVAQAKDVVTRHNKKIEQHKKAIKG